MLYEVRVGLEVALVREEVAVVVFVVAADAGLEE